MIKAVLFDLYGTLLYNKNRHKQIAKIIGEENMELYDKLRREWQGRNITSDAEFFKELIGEANLSEKMLPKLIIVWNKQIKYTHLYPETMEVLKALKKKGLKLGVVSNSLPITNKIIGRLKIIKYLDAIVLSFQVGAIKPNEKIYRVALKKLRVKPEETLFVGDDFENDIRVPRKIGMKAIQIIRRIKTKRNISDLRELLVKL